MENIKNTRSVKKIVTLITAKLSLTVIVFASVVVLNCSDGSSTDGDGRILPTLQSVTVIGHGIPGEPTLANDDAFGSSIAKVRDIAGGGIEIAVGAIRDDTGGANRGAIHLFTYNASTRSVKNTTKVVHETTATTGDGTKTLTLANDDGFGTSIANVGDLYRNGGTVLAVGAPGDDTGGSDSDSNRGAIHLLSYNASGTLINITRIAHGTPVNARSLELGDGHKFGSSIANLGNLDGGTVLAVGAPLDDTGGTTGGAIYLLSFDAGNITGFIKVNSQTRATDGTRITLADTDNFGSSIASVGKLNKDDDEIVIAVGAAGDNGFQGAIYLLSYSTGGTLVSPTTVPTNITKIVGGTPNGPTLAAGDLFGSSVANVGDLYRDGGTVIAVGASDDDTGGDAGPNFSDSNRGAIHLLFYNASGTLTGTTKVAHGVPSKITLFDSDNFGASIANVGSLDGGGDTVLAVGAKGDAATGTIHLLLYQ